MRRARRAVAAALLAAAGPGCHRAPPVDAQPQGAQTPPPATAPPVDHLATGELVEGTDRAFGLLFPRGLDLTSQFADVAYGSGRLTVHPVVQYLRSRLEGGDLHEGDRSATFDHVAVRGGKPGQVFTIHVATSTAGVRLEMRDMTPVPGPNFATDEERWKHVGLTPQGRVLDPTHLD